MVVLAVKHETIRFETRQDRPRYLARRFAPYLTGSVLDVGCDRAVLREMLDTSGYVGVDRSEEADVRHDLQSGGPLPFDDASFDTVICADVLEHLDNLHERFDDLIRVSRRFVVISLPNCWNAARLRFRRGHGSFKHYGLPVDPPEDRHRWFFNFEEALQFLDEHGRRHGLESVETVVLEKPRPWPVRMMRRLRHPRRLHYLNLYSHTVVRVFRRGDA